MEATCQRCLLVRSNWTISEASFNVGRLAYWKVQLCETCVGKVEATLRECLTPVPQVERP